MVNLIDLSVAFVESSLELSDEESIMNSIAFLKNLENLHLVMPYIDYEYEDPYKPWFERPIKIGLEKLSKLNTLDLIFQNKYIESPQILSLSKGILNLTNLCSLSLFINRAYFTDEASKSFGASIALLTDLK